MALWLRCSLWASKKAQGHPKSNGERYLRSFTKTSNRKWGYTPKSQSNRRNPKNCISGNVRDTLLTVQITDGVKEFSSGDHVPKDAACEDHPKWGPVTWWKLRKSPGREQRKTGHYGDLWGQLMSSSWRLSAEIDDAFIQQQQYPIQLW